MIHAFLRPLLLAAALLLSALPARADLLWNRTGLPLVFPLLVRSDPGLDWRVLLIDAETGKDAMAAQFRGGGTFRVLVPPGTFRLVFTGGPHWQGETAGFGPDGPSRRKALERPLTFQVKGIDRKAGHIVDLRGDGIEARAAPRGWDLCQDLKMARKGRDPAELYKGIEVYAPTRHDEVLDREVPNLGADPLELSVRTRPC